MRLDFSSTEATFRQDTIIHASAMKRLAYAAILLLFVGIMWFAVSRRHSATPSLPKTMSEFKQRPGGAATVDAGEFLIELAKAGKLPGFAQGEHGTMQAAVPPNASPEPYPISRALHFGKDGDTCDYFYIVTRESSADPWKLIKACRMDSAGHVLDDYPVR